MRFSLFHLKPRELTAEFRYTQRRPSRAWEYQHWKGVPCWVMELGTRLKAVEPGPPLKAPSDWGSMLCLQACSPLWSHECGSSYYTTGMCSRVNSNFRFSKTVAPALQSKSLQLCRLGLSSWQSLGGTGL